MKTPVEKNPVRILGLFWQKVDFYGYLHRARKGSFRTGLSPFELIGFYLRPNEIVFFRGFIVGFNWEGPNLKGKMTIFSRGRFCHFLTFSSSAIKVPVFSCPNKGQ